MPRISGVDIPNNKRLEVALTYIFGIGLNTSKAILKETKLDPDKRTQDLTPKEIAILNKILQKKVIEGDLRKTIRDNVETLKRLGAYRGLRHLAGLPSRGQRTRSNARTKRGKRQTVGALKKDAMAKKQTAEKVKK
jgi:small subunit ribosomal protein S13